MPEDPERPPVSSPPTPHPATEPTPATPKKEQPLGVVGWVGAILGLPVVVAALLAWCIGPVYLYQGLAARALAARGSSGPDSR